MKQLLFVCCIALLAACNNAGGGDAAKDTTGRSTAETPAAKKDIPEMPYKLDKPWANWRPGDPQHAVTVMTSLKAFETGDINKCLQGFGDTVKVYFDGMQGTFSRDSLGKMFTRERANFSNITVQMEDWESVISEDKKEEYVTLWYKQLMTDRAGKTDSVTCIDDARIKDGKIVQLSEAIRHYPVKK